MAKENFEESMKKLETIVTELENGNLNLDESVKKFEEGMKIAKQCNNIPSRRLAGSHSRYPESAPPATGSPNRNGGMPGRIRNWDRR